MSGGSINPLTVLGAVGGAASSGNSSTSVNRDPWGPAQPYLLANIDSASRLQKYYQDNPLSPIQQRAYANSFAGTDNARQGLSMLSSQLGQNQGWSRNSGSRLPQGYNFLPLGVNGGVSGGGMTGGLPTNPFSGGGIIPASPTSGAAGGGAGSPARTFSGDGGGSGRPWGGQSENFGSANVPGLTGALSLIGGVLNNLVGNPGAPNAVANPIGGYLGGLFGGIQPTSTNEQIANAGSPSNVSTTPGTTPTAAGNTVSNPMGIDPQQAAAAAAATAAIGAPTGTEVDPAGFQSGGGRGGGGDKIICTAMNEAYGFGSYRQAIWLKYSERMTKEHERGYHKLFLPLVKYAFHSGDGFGKRIVRNVLEHVARHRTADLRAEMHGRKRDTLGRIYRAIFEPLCYVAGKA